MRSFVSATKPCLLLTFAMAAACRPGEAIDTANETAAAPVPAQAWKVDASSRYFDYLSAATRNRVSENPHALGEQVCADLGARLESLTFRKDRFAANSVVCLFEEPGMREMVLVARIVQP